VNPIDRLKAYPAYLHVPRGENEAIARSALLFTLETFFHAPAPAVTLGNDFFAAERDSGRKGIKPSYILAAFTELRLGSLWFALGGEHDTSLDIPRVSGFMASVAQDLIRADVLVGVLTGAEPIRVRGLAWECDDAMRGKRGTTALLVGDGLGPRRHGENITSAEADASVSWGQVASEAGALADALRSRGEAKLAETFADMAIGIRERRSFTRGQLNYIRGEQARLLSHAARGSK